METVKNLLLILHVIAGGAAFLSSFIAAGSKMLNAPHQWHVLSGRIFYYSMVAIFLTSLPLSIMKGSMFILTIAIFSFYLAFAGWCYAKNKSGQPQRIDWARAIIMLVTAVGMVVYGIQMLLADNSQGITLLVFAGLGIGLGGADAIMSWKNLATGKNRIAQHLTMMLGATIATLTAFVVTNFKMEPAYILWLAPTVIITPLIVVWNFKIRS